jgi:hypothetical protein
VTRVELERDLRICEASTTAVAILHPRLVNLVRVPKHTNSEQPDSPLTCQRDLSKIKLSGEAGKGSQFV